MIIWIPKAVNKCLWSPDVGCDLIWVTPCGNLNTCIPAGASWKHCIPWVDKASSPGVGEYGAR